MLTGRVHPGESPSSWIMRGAIEYITGTCELCIHGAIEYITGTCELCIHGVIEYITGTCVNTVSAIEYITGTCVLGCYSVI